MRYKIIIDSCGELLDEWKKDECFESIPLTLMVGAEQIIDDETFDQAEFINKVAACPECPKSVEHYIEGQHTFFILENLDTLRKNGRLSKVKALVASALKIKPVMGSTDDGNICQLDQARGMNRALIKLVEQVIEKTPDSAEKVLAISHCNCPARAQVLKEAFEERMKLAKIVVLDTAGVSSMYANDGGVIVAV